MRALTEDDLVSFLPHFGDDCLARIHDSRKAIHSFVSEEASASAIRQGNGHTEL